MVGVVTFGLLALTLPSVAQQDANDVPHPILVIHDDDADRAVWIDEEQHILSRGRSAYRLWDAESGDLLVEMAEDEGDSMYAFALTSDEQRILSYTENRVRIWDVHSGDVLHEFIHPRFVRSVAWSSDETRVVSTDGDLWDCTSDCLWEVRLWDAGTGDVLQVIPQSAQAYASLSPDGTRLLTSNLDHQHLIWNAATGEHRVELGRKESWVTQAHWSKDSDRVLTMFLDGAIIIWDATTGAPLVTMQEGITGFGGGATWNADETQVLSWEDEAAYLWDAATGEQQFSMPHSETVMYATWDPGETRILTSSNDFTVQTWDAETGEPLVTFPHRLGVGADAWWNPDGSLLMTAAADSNVRLWDSQTGELLAVLPHKDDLIWGAAWNADETQMMTWASAVRSNNGGFIRIWDMSDLMPSDSD